MHYFIPRFNLLSVKLTREAQIELLLIFDVIMQSGISIMREWRTLRNIWSEFLQVHENREYNNTLHKNKKLSLLCNDECVMLYISRLNLIWKYIPQGNSSSNAIVQVSALSCKTPLQTLLLKWFLFEEHLTSLIDTCFQGNKVVYQFICRTAQNEKCLFDISTCKLLCASLLVKNGHFSSTLDIINQL